MKKIKIYKLTVLLIVSLTIASAIYYAGCSRSRNADENKDIDRDPLAEIEGQIDRKSKELKNTNERINALYSEDRLTRSAGIWSLIEHPDPIAIPHIMQLLKNNDIRLKTFYNRNHSGKSLDVFISIGAPVIPYIIDEFRTCLTQMPSEENEFFIVLLENTLSEMTSFPARYNYINGSSQEKMAVLQWWIGWWEKNGGLSNITWRKDSIRTHQKDLTLRNIGRVSTIKKLRQLTGLKYSEVIVNTSPVDYPPMKDRNGNFQGYPNKEDLKKW
ncbi:MAG: hypothetical protein V1871_04450 [Planctomycetota bacterium]